MGHEVGYHYEVLVKADGDPVKAMVLFQKDLRSFRENVEVHTISSHGSPLSKIDSRDLWGKRSYSNYGIAGDASVSVTGITYLSDTGGRWGSKVNVRDTMKDNKIEFAVHATSELIELVKKENNIKIYINCHPERWSINIIESAIQSITDASINVFKYAFMIKQGKNR